jgi:hypothetical protein
MLVSGLAFAVAALIVAGTRPPVAGTPWVHGFVRWFSAATPVDAVVVVTHRVALLVATWLLATTVLHLAAALSRVPALVRATAWAAIPGARRAVAAVVVTAGVLVPTAARAATGDAAAGTTAPAVVRDGRAARTTSTEASTPPSIAPTAPSTGPTASSVGPVAPPVTSPVTLPGAAGVPPTVVVREGDSLWSIAAQVVASEEGRPGEEVPGADVAGRWVAIEDANITRLRSGDLSLIYPGEEVVVPE